MRDIFLAGSVCFVMLVFLVGFTFLYLSDAFRPQPAVSIHPFNTFSDTLHVVTDSDYEPFSFIDHNGQYAGMDVELIVEIANRLHMNLDLKLMSWTEANKLFLSGHADAFLNMETDSAADDPRVITTLPTVEKQYVVYGREAISSVPELYGRKTASLHVMPELGLEDYITYIDSYTEIFEGLRDGLYDFAICPIQIGNAFLEKFSMSDVRPGYAVGHIYGAIALLSDNNELRERINYVIHQLQAEGVLDELDRKWVSHRYQSMSISGMIEAHPGVMIAFLAGVMFMVFMFVCLMLQNRNIRDKDAYSHALQEKNEELTAAKDKAEASSRAKSTFLSNMSHEIRTPINAVLGMNEMILRESSDDRITSYADSIERAGRNLLAIINDILDFSKIEAGKMEIIQAPYKLSSLINDTAGMITFRAHEKNLDFMIDVDETLPDGILGDEVRVRQVLVNILSNAVKYTSEGSVSFSAKGTRTSSDSITLIFSVTDTGTGITPEGLSKLFNKFERADLIHNRTIEGTGLGLAITRNILDLMGGTITAESTYGQGSTFTVHIPQRVTSWDHVGNFREKFERAASSKHTYQESFKAPEAKILAVDDTEMNLTVVTGLLSKTQIQIDTAPGGEEALRMTKRTHYDLILMDQMMPGMDGTEAMRRIKAQEGGASNESPILCLTADAVSGARESYLEQGFTDYIAKPVEWKELEAALRRYLPPEKVILQTTEETHKEEVKPASKLQELYEGIDELNFSDAVKFCMNEEILEKTLRSFWEAIDSNAEAVSKFLSEHDYRNYTIKVHALKSSARLIGAGQLSSDAAFLEECGDNLSEESIRLIEERTPKLLEDYTALKAKLAPLYAQSEDLPEISSDELHELYDAIREFSLSFDSDAIDGILEQARKFRIPPSEKEHFDAISTAARNMDWGALEEALG